MGIGVYVFFFGVRGWGIEGEGSVKGFLRFFFCGAEVVLGYRVLRGLVWF